MTTCSVPTYTTHHHHSPHPSLTFMGSGTGSHSGSGSSNGSDSPPPIKTEPKDAEEEEGGEEGGGDYQHQQQPTTTTNSKTSGGIATVARHSPPVGLLNNRNLVQDEKLVVATLASLESGDPSNIIKQDLRLIIQSRRKAEGKGELQVDFKSPPKDELTEEEWERAQKRRDQNRLAAQRFRQKQRKISSTLSDRVRRLESANTQLKKEMHVLETEKYNLLKLVLEHGRDCSNREFNLKLQRAMDSGLITRDFRKWPTYPLIAVLQSVIDVSGTKQQLTTEELEKRARRRELNRLAAKRSREKGQRRKDTLIQEIQVLQTHNGALEGDMGKLLEERDSLVRTLKGHLPRCSNSFAMTRSAQLLAFSHRLAQLLDWALPHRALGAPCPGMAGSPSSDHPPPQVKVEPLHHAPPPPAQPPPPPHTPHPAYKLPLRDSVGYGSDPPSPLPTAAPPLTTSTSAATTPVLPLGGAAPSAVPYPGCSLPPLPLGPLPPDLPSPSSSSHYPLSARGPSETHTPTGESGSSRGLEIDAAAAAMFREEIERHHQRYRVSAPASPAATQVSGESHSLFSSSQSRSSSSPPPLPHHHHHHGGSQSHSQPITPTHPHPHSHHHHHHHHHPHHLHSPTQPFPSPCGLRSSPSSRSLPPSHLASPSYPLPPAHPHLPSPVSHSLPPHLPSPGSGSGSHGLSSHLHSPSNPLPGAFPQHLHSPSSSSLPGPLLHSPSSSANPFSPPNFPSPSNPFPPPRPTHLSLDISGSSGRETAGGNSFGREAGGSGGSFGREAGGSSGSFGRETGGSGSFSAVSAFPAGSPDAPHIGRGPLSPQVLPTSGLGSSSSSSSAQGSSGQGVIKRPQSLDLRGVGIIPKKDPALRSPVIPKKDPALRSPVATTPKKDPALRSPLTPKKDPALRSPVIPKKDPALRSPVIDTSSPPSASSSSLLSSSSSFRTSGVFKRGPVQRVASFHGVSTGGGSSQQGGGGGGVEQVAPLNLSKRRKSEDFGYGVSITEVGGAGGGSHPHPGGFSGLHTWPPPGMPSWVKREEEERVLEESSPLNLVCREQHPSATVTSGVLGGLRQSSGGSDVGSAYQHQTQAFAGTSAVKHEAVGVHSEDDSVASYNAAGSSAASSHPRRLMRFSSYDGTM